MSGDDVGLEAGKERAWREIARIDAAYVRGEIDDDGWHRAMAALILPAYLGAASVRGGSGHSGSEEDWEWSRGIVVAIQRVTAEEILESDRLIPVELRERGGKTGISIFGHPIESGASAGALRPSRSCNPQTASIETDSGWARARARI